MNSQKQRIINKKINILRKIDEFSLIPTKSISIYFSKEEISIINIMIDEGKLAFNGDGFTTYDEEERLVITNYGQRMLFCSEYSNLILEFCELLEENGYSNNFDLIMDFLITQDLKQNPREILTINNFENFSMMYDRCIEKDDESVDNICNVLRLSYKICNDK